MLEFDDWGMSAADIDTGAADEGWGDWVSESASKAWDFLSTTEAGAGVMAGAATGTAQYLLQKDKQRHEEKLADKRYKRELDVKFQYSQAPLVDMTGAGNGLLSAAAAMGGDEALIGRKKVS